MLRMATDDPRQQDGVTCGVDGIAAYADDLADLSRSGAKQEEGGYFQGGWRGCHNIYPQMSGRAAAEVYLKRIAPLFRDTVKEHLLTSADEYGKATSAWQEFEDQLGRPLEDKHDGAWQDPERRQAGAAAVRKAYEHEKRAIAALTKAVELLRDAEPDNASDSE